MPDFREKAYDDWLADIYDDWYPDLNDPANGPQGPVQTLLATFDDLPNNRPEDIRILDCAAGTGNLYIALSKAGFDVWATDGSAKMLEKAASNCRKAGVPDTKLIRESVPWTDSQSYLRHFREKGILFDVILANSNSFCHLPSVPGQMDVALRNFWELLKPGGRILIDTKRYVRTDTIDGVPIYRELRFVDEEWIIRTDRSEPRKIEGLGEVTFHTRMHYDIDPFFKVCRAHIVVTIFGDSVLPKIHLVPYYPLPAAKLTSELSAIGFAVDCVDAKTAPLNWSYDFVMAQRPK